MKLPQDTSIASKKLTHYLLAWREENDKSAFLMTAGYTSKDAKRLEADLRNQLLPLDAKLADRDEYGDKYLIRGRLEGPNGRALRVVSIWMFEKAGGKWKFLTLYPDKT